MQYIDSDIVLYIFIFFCYVLPFFVGLMLLCCSLVGLFVISSLKRQKTQPWNNYCVFILYTLILIFVPYERKTIFQLKHISAERVREHVKGSVVRRAKKYVTDIAVSSTA